MKYEREMFIKGGARCCELAWECVPPYNVCQYTS